MCKMTSSATMRAVVVRKPGNPTDPETVAVDSIAMREPGEAEVRIKVKSAAVNPVDYKLIEGSLPGGKKPGQLVGCDVSGVVDKVGPGCTSGLQVGDEVYADVAATQGSFAEFVNAQEKCVGRKPRGLSFREAASLPLAGLTALQALQRQGELREGGRVCVLGGSGGVGSLAVQMAKALGASFVATTSTSTEMVRSLGADRCINYREEDVAEALKGQNFDVVFDCVGGRESWVQAQGGLKKGGRFVTIVGDGHFDMGMMMKIANRKLWSVFGWPRYRIFMTDTDTKAHITADLQELTRLVDEGKLKPLLDDRKFTLSDESVRELFAASMSHRTKGKLVMDVA